MIFSFRPEQLEGDQEEIQPRVRLVKAWIAQRKKNHRIAIKDSIWALVWAGYQAKTKPKEGPEIYDPGF